MKDHIHVDNIKKKSFKYDLPLRIYYFIINIEEVQMVLV